MKKRLGAALIALTMLTVSACDSNTLRDPLGIEKYGTNKWILSDMKEPARYVFRTTLRHT